MTVALDPPYDIDVGIGVLDRLEVHRSRYRRLAVVTQHGIRAALGPLLDAVVGDSLVIEIGDGEGAKTMASAASSASTTSVVGRAVSAPAKRIRSTRGSQCRRTK